MFLHVVLALFPSLPCAQFVVGRLLGCRIVRGRSFFAAELGMVVHSSSWFSSWMDWLDTRGPFLLPRVVSEFRSRGEKAKRGGIF